MGDVTGNEIPQMQGEAVDKREADPVSSIGPAAGPSLPLGDKPAALEAAEDVGGVFYIEPKADLIYGASGTGKTQNIEDASNYVLEKYGKLTRMVSADGGGAGPAKGLVDSRQIEFWGIRAWKNPVAALYKAVRGYWPLRLDDPESPLVPPNAGTWEIYGLGAYEGLTSFGDLILQTLKDKKASLSQDPSYTWREGDVDFSGGNMSYYGFMQDQLQSFVGISHILGYEKILWTAQESKGDDLTGSKVYGPMISGKKATGKAANWFLNVFHMDLIQGPSKKDEKTGELIAEAVHVLYLKTHIDPASFIPFPCKTRAPKQYGGDIPIYLPSGSVAEAYRLLDKLYEKQKAESESRMDKIAGLRDRLLENAARARKAEAEAAEKRAKALGLLKTNVAVPAIPAIHASTVSIGAGGVASGTAASKPAIPGLVTSGKISPVATTIQQVKKGKG